MTQDKALSEHRRKVREMIEHIEVALFVTHSDGDGLRSRPMAALKSDLDEAFWFASRSEASKVQEVADNTQVLLAYSEPKTQNYVSVNGRANVVRDRAKIAEMWQETMRVWFPAGPEDPDLILIRVEADGADYWDAPSAAWIQLFGYARARLTGQPLHDVGDTGRVRL